MFPAKKIFTLLILFFYLLAINANLIAWIEYNINYDFILKFLCIQKDVPENLCKGSCQLKKNLEQNEEQNKPAEKQNRETNNFSISYHLENSQSDDDILFSYRTKKYQFTSNNFLSNLVEPESPPPKLL